MSTQATHGGRTQRAVSNFALPESLEQRLLLSAVIDEWV